MHSPDTPYTRGEMPLGRFVLCLKLHRTETDGDDKLETAAPNDGTRAWDQSREQVI